jgi:hypothetical protein
MRDWSFTRHPTSVGETYFRHMASALGFAARLFAAGIACVVHAVLPFFFITTASRMVLMLHERMTTGRSRTSPDARRAALGSRALEGDRND